MASSSLETSWLSPGSREGVVSPSLSLDKIRNKGRSNGSFSITIDKEGGIAGG